MHIQGIYRKFMSSTESNLKVEQNESMRIPLNKQSTHDYMQHNKHKNVHKYV